MTPTEVDQPAEAVTTTDANSAAATTQPRRSLRLLKNQKSQVTTTSSLRAEPRQPRAPRPVDPIQRRKKGQLAHHHPLSCFVSSIPRT